MIDLLKQSKFTLIVLFALFVSSCFDKPDEFVSPTWDAQVNVPITSKQFNLLEIVEKDSSLLKASEDSETLGLIYFGESQSFSSIEINDDLKIDGFDTEFSENLGPILVKIPIPVASEIRVEDWTTEVTSGSFQVFPEQEGDVEIEIAGVETVESVLIDEGKLTVIVVNRLPVEIVLRGMRILNESDGSLVAERSSAEPSEWVSIPPLQFDSVSFPVNNKIVTNSLIYEGRIWSHGSNGQEVQIPEEAGTTVLALFRDLVIGAATGQLPSQEFSIDGEIMIDDSTKVEEAYIEEGSVELVVNNYVDLDVFLNVLFENLFDENNEQYSLDLNLGRGEQNRTVSIPSLKDWKIATDNPGVPTNKIKYRVQTVTDSTGEVSSIGKNDSVSFNIAFNELVFRSFKGQLKPLNINLDESGFKLDYGNFDEKVEFGSLNFQDAVIIMNLRTSADINIQIDGELSADNGLRTNNKLIENVILPSPDRTEIDISELINGFTLQLPDSFSLKADGLINPNYEIAEVSRQDSIFGNVEFEIPLNVGISEGSFKDTIEVEFGDIDEDDIERLNYGELTFTIINSVPVNLNVTAEVLDSIYGTVLELPTLYNDLDYIEVPQPEVSEIGETLNVGTKTQTFILLGEDISKLLNNPYILLKVYFATAGIVNQGDIPVKFQTTDEISFDIRLKAEYRVEL